MQAAKMGVLRDKLARGNLTSVAFLIVNEQDALSRAMYWQLKRRAAEGIPVYQQSPLQDDIWDTLQGDKDDFLVYDRCGYLTFHIGLPYSFLHLRYVEAAIQATYLGNICNCTLNSTQLTSSNVTTERSSEQNTTAIEPQNTNLHHHHHHHHHHHYHHHDYSQIRSTQNPAITQITSTTTEQEHTHHDSEH
ncbi:hypothetical protein KOW79_016606 [Hemibagrus wyckioides]|uniref:Selenoprotein P N-terminal domain-containing protein n=2 Tax=Hemibagrus wyckioides TaxID=337641 RepID=A0A9D3NAP8_9TELE|nr:hypothetical protein KOW79_016606 [Hemibagrus wyckioides]